MFLRILRAAAIAVLAIGFLRGLAVFGATRTPDLYRLFLIVGIPTAACALGLFGTTVLRRRWMWAALSLGLLLFFRAGWAGAVEGRGYVLLALGWSAFFITAVVGGRSVGAARGFAFGLIAIGVFETLYGLAQSVAGFDYIGGYERNMGRVATGTLFNRNHYAGMLNLIIPITLGTIYAIRALPQNGEHSPRLRRTEGGKPFGPRPESETLAGAWLALLISAFMGLAVLLSQSRGGTATMVMCLILAAVLLQARRRSRRRWASSSPWILLILLLGLGSGVGIDALLTKFSASEASLLNRGAIFLDTLRLIGDHPWLGVGPSMYAWSFRAYQSVSGQVWYDYAHNDYLQTVAEWGIPIALAFWAWTYWRFCRACMVFFAARDAWVAGLSLGCAVSIFSILLHSLVDFNMYIPTNLMVFGSVLGLAWSLDKLHSDRDSTREEN